MESSGIAGSEMTQNMYESGEYLSAHPTWDVEDSPWKAEQVLKMIERNKLNPGTICEVGCGAGGILFHLQQNLPDVCEYHGFEISPQAHELCLERANDKLRFTLGDFLRVQDVFYDVILLMDVIEHLEDYFSFLREIKNKSKYKIIHLPLNLSVQSIMRIGSILRSRKVDGHIHYFTKEIALEMMRDSGYEIIDCFFTPSSFVNTPGSENRSGVAKILRKVSFMANQDMAVRIFGGYSLMILAK